MYRSPSSEYRYAPSARSNASGNGSKCRTLRVFAPGRDAAARSAGRALAGLAATYRAIDVLERGHSAATVAGRLAMSWMWAVTIEAS